MKTVVMILGLLLLGAMAYFGYSYGVEKSEEINKVKSSDKIIEEKVKSIDTEVAIEEDANEEQKEADIAVKSSIEEDIPTEEIEELIEEEDIIENEEGVESDMPENIEDIIDEQEALMEEAAKEELEPKDNNDSKPYISSEEMMQKVEKEKAGVPLLETEEERIIREEEEKNQEAMAEDNVSE